VDHLLQELKIGDVVYRFGSLTSENFQGMQNIASIVQHSIDVSMTLMKITTKPFFW